MTSYLGDYFNFDFSNVSNIMIFSILVSIASIFSTIYFMKKNLENYRNSPKKKVRKFIYNAQKKHGIDIY